MKKVPTLFLALLGPCLSASAQHNLVEQPFNNRPALRQHWQGILPLLNRQQPDAARTTATKQRILAESLYQLVPGTPVLRDTLRYAYTGDHGSVFNLNAMFYSTIFEPVHNDPYVINNDALKPDVACDSTVRHTHNGTALVLAVKEHMKHDAALRVTDYARRYFTNGTVSSLYRFTADYDNQGRPTTAVMWYDSPSGQWDSVVLRRFSYNAAGLLTGDSSLNRIGTGVWSPETKHILTYDGGNKLIGQLTAGWSSTGWHTWQRHTLTYYPDNKLKDVTQEDEMGGSFVPKSKDSVSYAPGTSFYQTWTISEADGNGNLAPVYRVSKHLNSLNLPDTAYIDVYDAGSWTMQKVAFVYNSYNNPDYALLIESNGTASTRQNFYYEEYETSSIPNISAGTIKVFPNPAHTVLNMEWRDAGPNRQVSIVLSDLAGRPVHSEELYWKGNTLSIPTNNLLPGMYLLSVTDAQGRRLHAQSVLKQ